jgi:hypothetical protein
LAIALIAILINSIGPTSPAQNRSLAVARTEPGKETGPELSAARNTKPPVSLPAAPSADRAPLASIRGVVVSYTGIPIKAATVLASTAADYEVEPGEKCVQTDEQGRFELRVPSTPAPSILDCYANGYLPASVAASVGEENRIVLELGGTITGRVLGPDEAPIQGAAVVAHLDENYRGWPLEQARFLTRGRSTGATSETDAEGRFQLGGLLPSKKYGVLARRRGWTREGFADDDALTLPNSGEVTLHLRPYGEVLLTAVDRESDRAIPVGHCRWMIGSPPGTNGVFALDDVRAAGGLPGRHSISGSVITFRFGVRSGASVSPLFDTQIDARVWALGYEPAKARVRARPGGSGEVIRVALERSKGSELVRLKVKARFRDGVAAPTPCYR